jgi:phospholipid/cholesterol/gamma-HCH transport system substrate-binding protein
VNRITATIEEGEGTLGKLLKDEGLYERLVEIAEKMDEISVEIAEGEGTLGKLVHSNELYKKAEEALTNLNAASTEVKDSIGENREKINKIVSIVSEEISRLEEVIDGLSEVSEKVREGEGTLGKLVNDPTLYEDAQKAVNQVEETFKQQEEQAIFQTFVGVVLGSFF